MNELPFKSSRSWGVRFRMWLVVIILVIAIVKHKPFLGIAVALLLGMSALMNYLARRKQRRNA